MLGGVTEEAFPTKLEAQAIAAAWPFEPTGLPFIPVAVREGYWVFTCPLLDWQTGRCTEYETRPALCRNYEPKSDPLCAEYVAPPPA